MTFEEYLTKRRVNVPEFAAAEPQRFAEWQNWFGQMHPESFYLMVKMVLNDVRRKYWLAEVPKPVISAETAETGTAAPARPAGRRAAIARPASATTETPKTEIPAETIAKPASEITETKPAETINPAAETSASKPVRPVFKPRGVIKKTTTPEESNLAAETPESAKPTETSGEIIPPVEPKPETENAEKQNPEQPAAKPARPRAVIKRPAALSRPEPKPEETGENTIGNSAEKVEEQNSGTVADLLEKEKPETGKADEAPKPPRPRPVFKRPAAASTSEITASETEKTVGETPQKPETTAKEDPLTASPVAIPGQEGASEAKAVSEEIHDNPEAAKAAEEVAAEAGHVPKPPRPRPVFKRPATARPPENSSEETEKTVSETTQKSEANSVAIQPEKPAENLSEMPGNPEEKVEEPVPKPPRPRPIFKRPSKPESESEM